MDIRKNICTTLLITIALSIITIVISGIVLGCNGDEEPIYKAISLYGNYFGGISTIIAALVATWLYADWRIQVDYSNKLKLLEELISHTFELKDQINNLRAQRSLLDILMQLLKIIKNNDQSIEEKSKQADETIKHNIFDLNQLFKIMNEIEKSNAKIQLLYNGENCQHLSDSIKLLNKEVTHFQVNYSLIFKPDSLKKILNYSETDFHNFSCHISSLYFICIELITEDPTILSKPDPIDNLQRAITDTLATIYTLKN